MSSTGAKGKSAGNKGKGDKSNKNPPPQQPQIIFAGTVGTTHEFVAGSDETWPIYMEHLGIYFRANGIEDVQRQKNILLSAMGSSAYIQLRKLCAPKKPEDLSYKQINKTLLDFYNPASSKYVKRDEFNNRKQNPGESFAEFVADLNGLSENCGFDDAEDAILGQILSGMRDIGLKKHLLQQPKLTLNEVKRKGMASDTAYHDARKMSAPASTDNQQDARKCAPIPSKHYSAPPKHHPQGPNQGQGPKQGSQSAGAKGHKQGGPHPGHPNITVNVNLVKSPGANKSAPPTSGGGSHPTEKGGDKDKTCNYCKKQGHVLKNCRILKAKAAAMTEKKMS